MNLWNDGIAEGFGSRSGSIFKQPRNSIPRRKGEGDVKELSFRGFSKKVAEERNVAKQ